MKKKFLTALLAVVLIIIVAAAAFGAKILDRYSYSKEKADLDEYFNLQGDDEIAVVLQDELVDE